MRAWKLNALLVIGLLILAACGKDDPKPGQVTNEVEAQRYFNQFRFKRNVPSTPLSRGTGTYLQGPELRLTNVQGDVHGKMNLFLLDDNVFLLEWTEITDENPADGKIFGQFNGVVIEGNWYIQGTELVLEAANRKEIARAKPHTTETGEAAIRLEMKADLKNDFNPTLKAGRLTEPRPMVFKSSNRLLPHDLRKDLPKDMTESSRVKGGFKD